MTKIFLLTFFLIHLSVPAFAQHTNGFQFSDPTQRSLKINFKLVNNLIVIPVQLNGIELSFLLDTGVDKTLLIALQAGDSIDLNRTKKVDIQGLGEEDSFEAYQSIGNTLQIENAINTNQDVYFIIDKNNELTKRLGLPVNGIIGYDLFKDFIVRINYKKRTIKLYNPDKFNRKLRRYEKLPLQFFRNKPYVSLKVFDETLNKNNLIFLIDTGSGTSFWLFENEFVDLPDLYFEDILGYGLRSIIQGKRSKVDQINFGKYKFKNPNVAYPNIEQILQIEKSLVRDGTVGAETLRRFKLFVDYPNKRLFFRANNDINDSFNYDMSGLVLDFDGVKIVKELKSIKMSTKNEESDYPTRSTTDFIISVGVKPKISVKTVRENSPADDAAILPGDELLKINGKNAYDLDLEEIQSILAEKAGKKVKLEFLRNERNMKKEIYLRDRLKDLLNNPKN